MMSEHLNAAVIEGNKSDESEIEEKGVSLQNNGLEPMVQCEEVEDILSDMGPKEFHIFHCDFISKDLRTQSLITEIESKLPHISITPVVRRQPKRRAISATSQRLVTTKKLETYANYKTMSPAEIEARLHNVSVTLIRKQQVTRPGVQCAENLFSSTDDVAVENGTHNEIGYATAQWFYLQYINAVEHPTLETLYMASVAASAAAAAYQNAHMFPDTLPLSERILGVATQAAKNVFMYAFNMMADTSNGKRNVNDALQNQHINGQVPLL